LYSLPNSVGISLDVTTGELKFPSIEMTYSGKQTFTDTISKKTFIIPDNVTFSQNINQYNTPKVNIFKNENELNKIWEDNYKSNKWMGGEFGIYKDLQNLFSIFFNENQASSINQ